MSVNAPKQDGYYWFVGEIGDDGVTVRTPEIVQVRVGSVWRHGLDIKIPLVEFRGEFTGPLTPPTDKPKDGR